MAGTLNMLVGAGVDYFAVASPVAVDGTGSAPGITQTNRAVEVSVKGGTPPYTYLWSQVSGDAATYAKNPTSAVTRFAVYSASGGVTFNTVYKCTVTDANSNVVDSNTISVFLQVL